jgi:PAS domain S-box-containing protein
MKRRSWLGLEKTDATAQGWLGSISRAAAGKSSEALLELAARTFLSATGADRAGVWVEGENGSPLWRGAMLGANTTDLLPETFELDPENLPAGVREGRTTIAGLRPSGPFRWLAGMRTAIWLPLRENDDVFGVVVVAHAEPVEFADGDLLEGLAAELSLVWAERRELDRLSRTQQAAKALSGLHHALPDGVAGRQLLQAVASAAVRHRRAEFVAVGRFVGGETRWEALEGRPEYASLLQGPAISALVRSARETDRSRSCTLPRTENDSGAEREGLSLLVAVPVRADAAVLGMLVAGFAHAAETAERQLEGYAALACAGLGNSHTANPASPADVALKIPFESSAEALLILNSRGAVKQFNRRAHEFFGLRQPLAQGMIFQDLLAPESREAAAAWMRDASREAVSGPVECRLQTGGTVRLSFRGALPPENHLLLSIEAGSLAQRAEQKWRQLQAELRSVLDAVEAGVLLLDAAGYVRFVNAQFGQLFGLDARLLTELRSFDELVDLVQDRFRDPQMFAGEWRDQFRDGEQAIREEVEMVRPHRRVIERYVRPVLDDEGGRLGWLEVYRDVTNQRQFQSKLLQTEKMAALGQLVSGIAHELNNPLTAIMGYAQLLLGRDLRPPQLAETKNIFQEAERARRIVKNLLYFAREAKPERMPADLNEIIQRTLALRGYELKVENIEVECELDPHLPVTMADAYQLQQVVLNLIVNAEQALLHGRGSGRIWIRTHRPSESRIALEVADDGPGIPPEVASRVFDPFFTTKPPGVGTGLGLSIVYGIVHEHGGEVFLESTPGAGARFVVEIPIVPVPARTTSAEKQLPEAAPMRGPAGRILVVEDEPTVAQLIADVLREEGHQVDAVVDSQEGLNCIARTRYDLVICDLRMPRLDGPAFYDALVRSGSPVQHKIIFITGDTLAPRTLEFLEPHGLPYLAKPFLVEELKLAVSRMLDQARNKSDFSLPPKNSGGGPEANPGAIGSQ